MRVLWSVDAKVVLLPSVICRLECRGATRNEGRKRGWLHRDCVAVSGEVANGSKL